MCATAYAVVTHDYYVTIRSSRLVPEDERATIPHYGGDFTENDTIDNFVTGTLLPKACASPRRPETKVDDKGGTHLSVGFVPTKASSDLRSLPPRARNGDAQRRTKAYNILGINIKPKSTFKPCPVTATLKTSQQQRSTTSKPPWYTSQGKRNLPSISALGRVLPTTTSSSRSGSKAEVARIAEGLRVKSAARSSSNARGGFAAARRAGSSSSSQPGSSNNGSPRNSTKKSSQSTTQNISQSNAGLQDIGGQRAQPAEMFTGGYSTDHHDKDTFDHFGAGLDLNPTTQPGQYPAPKAYEAPAAYAVDGPGMKAAPYGKGHEDKDTFSHLATSNGVVPVAGSSMVGGIDRDILDAPKYAVGHEGMDTKGVLKAVDGQLSTEEGVARDENQEYGQHYGGDHDMYDTRGNIGKGMVPTYYASGKGWAERQREAALSAKRQQTKRASLVVSFPGKPVYEKPPVETDVKFVAESLKQTTVNMFLPPPQQQQQQGGAGAGAGAGDGAGSPPRVVRMGYTIAGNANAVPESTLFVERPWRSDGLADTYSGLRRGEDSDIRVVFPGKVILKPADTATVAQRL